MAPLSRDIEDLHNSACLKKNTFYIDPATGYQVFTSYHLSTRPCCSSGCRHCPYPTTQKAAITVLTGDLDSVGEECDVLFWSGGKDSFLALRRLQRDAKRDVVLLTTFNAFSGRVAHQDVSIEDVVAFVNHLGLVLIGVPLGGEDYVERVAKGLKKISNFGIEIIRLAFGDLHLHHIRTWRESQLNSLGASLCFPLWNVPYAVLIKDLQRANVSITISAVDRDNASLRDIKIGDEFNSVFVRKLPDGVDKFGENGEFHSLVSMR